MQHILLGIHTSFGIQLDQRLLFRQKVCRFDRYQFPEGLQKYLWLRRDHGQEFRIVLPSQRLE